MNKPVLFVPRGAKIPESWKLTDTPTYATGPIQVLGKKGEKSLGVVAHPTRSGELPTLILGGYELYTEDLKELAERMREEDRANLSESLEIQKQKENSWRDKTREMIEKKVQEHKRNFRTNPAPSRFVKKGLF